MKLFAFTPRRVPAMHRVPEIFAIVSDGRAPVLVLDGGVDHCPVRCRVVESLPRGRVWRGVWIVSCSRVTVGCPRRLRCRKKARRGLIGIAAALGSVAKDLSGGCRNVRN